MINPTIGRVVWFYHYVPSQGHKGPMAAHVCHVVSDSRINLMVIDEYGNTHGESSVLLLQDDTATAPPLENYCTWMPYQKGQAAKTEALEAAVAK